LRLKPSHHCRLYVFRGKQDSSFSPSPLHFPRTVERKHHQLFNSVCTPLAIPIGKQGNISAHWICSPRLLHRRNDRLTRYISTRTPFLDNRSTSIPARHHLARVGHRNNDSYNTNLTILQHSITIMMPAPNTQSLRMRSMRGNMTCCFHPSSHHHNNRSLSPYPDEPARPSPLTLDSIFALAALPTNHPHALKIGLPASGPEDETNLSIPKRRLLPQIRKNLSSSALSSSGLVHRVGRRLRRRATFGGAGGGDGIGSLTSAAAITLSGQSLRNEARFDADAKRLSSGEVLGAVDATTAAAASTSGFVRTTAVGCGGGGGDPPALRLREL